MAFFDGGDIAPVTRVSEGYDAQSSRVFVVVDVSDLGWTSFSFPDSLWIGMVYVQGLLGLPGILEGD